MNRGPMPVPGLEGGGRLELVEKHDQICGPPTYSLAHARLVDLRQGSCRAATAVGGREVCESGCLYDDT
jgi:hypothetical protein